jgi:hypothetical protein
MSKYPQLHLFVLLLILITAGTLSPSNGFDSAVGKGSKELFTLAFTITIVAVIIAIVLKFSKLIKK